MNVSIRPAQTFDAAFAAPLIQEAKGRVGQHLTGTTTDEDAAHVIAVFFASRGNRLSYTNTLLAEGEEERPLGLAVLYLGEAQALDGPFREHRRLLGLDPAPFPPRGGRTVPRHPRGGPSGAEAGGGHGAARSLHGTGASARPAADPAGGRRQTLAGHTSTRLALRPDAGGPLSLYSAP